MASGESTAQTRERLEQEAVVWFARWASGEMTPQEQAQFEHWKQQSPAHEKASRKMQRLWGMLPAVLEDQPQTLPDSDIQAQAPDNVVPLVASNHKPKHSAIRLACWGLGLATAASLMIGLCLGYCSNYLLHPWADYRTLVGEQRSVQLSDGSTLYLNTDTALDVSMTDSERRIVLLQGEAEFDVAHNSQRPFRVTAGHTTTEAIGTRFLVRFDDATGDVTLLEGKVRTTLAANDGSKPDGVVLNPGQHLSFDETGLGAVQSVEPSQANAWRRNRLNMNFATLGEVIAEINRYRPGHVLLLDEELAQQKVHVAVDIRLIDDWLDALSSTLPLRIMHIRLGHLVLLQRAD